MIPTAQITSALVTFITGLDLFDRVSTHDAADLTDALGNLRDPSRRLAFVVPGADSFEHQLVEGLNIPVHTEVRCEMQVIVSNQSAAYAPSDLGILPLKDRLLLALLWNTLGNPDLICLPQSCEPMRIEWDDAPARSAWQITLQIRQQIAH